MTFTVKTISEGTSAEHYAVWHNGRSICTTTCPQWAVRIANAMNAAQAQEDLHRDAALASALASEIEATCSPTAKLLEAKDAEIAKLDAMLFDLIDAHYGASYHHIGDGDGVTKQDADKIREWLKQRAAKGGA